VSMVIVPVGAGGQVMFYNRAGTVDVIVDLTGYLTPNGGAGFTGVASRRVMDTRLGTGVLRGKIGAGRVVTLAIPRLPAGTTAVVLSVTAVNPTATSYLTVYPGGGVRPGTSNLYFTRGQSIVSMVIVPVGAGGQVMFYNRAGTVDVIVDLTGYFSGDLPPT